MLWDCEREPVFLTDKNGRLVFFGSLAELNEFAERNVIDLSEEITAYDLDDTAVTAETLDCGEVINKWNIISDFALSSGLEFSGEDKSYNNIYNKLFFGCNLPAMKHPHFIPEWSASEIVEINRVLSEGAALVHMILK